ncbi:MAG: lipoyl synthase [Pseudomonadota bacterium]|nr:lipoyl synthase [Pseudomonadota bacterium]
MSAPQNRLVRAQEKLSRIPVKITPNQAVPAKPNWIKIKLPNTDQVKALKEKIKSKKLVTVCEEASCPNIYECYNHGTATFMIMGDKCTRRCSFCDVAHGRPDKLDKDEPLNLAETVMKMGLKYVVITSVDRDDLRDGGAQHFVDCINKVREFSPNIKIEVLTPDFRRRHEKALDIFEKGLPDVFNHNIETVPRLYLEARPGSSYIGSLELLQQFKARNPSIPTKSGIMLGLGETDKEVIQTLEDLRKYDVDMLTIGQYLQPTTKHYPVRRYVSPEEFDKLGEIATGLGFTQVASGPLVRSSYHADKQAAGEAVS